MKVIDSPCTVWSFLLFLVFVPFLTNGQLSITLQVIPATCSSNGSIHANVTGGSGEYRYELIDTCGGTFLPGTDPQFKNLPPCRYEVIVTDRQTQEKVRDTVSVRAEYQEMNITLRGSGCRAEASVKGGLGPYRYFFSKTGREGPYIPNIPIDNPVFTTEPGEILWIRVEDACGRSINKSATSTSNPITGLRYSAYRDGIRIFPEGGYRPVVFELQSDRGTIADSTGFFPWEVIGCNPLVRLSDGCTDYSEVIFNLKPTGKVVCVDFENGYALLEPGYGIPPFTYQVVTPESSFTSSSGEFLNLPVNDSYYYFYIIDSCGRSNQISSTTRYKPVFEPVNLETLTADTSLNFTIGRQCTGTLQFPITAVCNDCTSFQTKTVKSYKENQITFTGNQIGNWQFSFYDSCGDSVVCKDSLVLELTPACDSIISRVVDRFDCSNGTFARRELILEEVMFYLKNELGEFVDSSATGKFQGLSSEEYQVLAVISSRDTLKERVKIGEPRSLSPFFRTKVKNQRVENGRCETFYSIELEQEQGPFLITNETGDYYEVFDDFDEDNCLYYPVGPLPPGIYRITSLSRCGSISLELPKPKFQLTAEVLENCPNDGQVAVGGVRTLSEWIIWYAPFDLNIDWSSFYLGGYDLNHSGYSTFGEKDHVFKNLPAGRHIFSMHPFNGIGCLADTAVINIEPYREITPQVKGDVLCDGNLTTNLSISVLGGSGPYLLKSLNCTEKSQVFTTFQLDSTGILLKDVPAGAYCFTIEDRCNLNKDFEINVAPFQDDIRLEYTCDEKVELRVDSFPFTYRWTDASNQVVSTGPKATIPIPVKPEPIHLTIDLEKCRLEREVMIQPRAVIPEVSILASDSVLCGTDTITLHVQSNATGLTWNTGETETWKEVLEEGFYSVLAENELGCRNSDSIFIRQKQPPSEILTGPAKICEDSTITLSLLLPFSIGEWSTGEVAGKLIVMNSGTYSVTVTDREGCQWQDSLTVRDLKNPVVRILGDTLICPNRLTELKTGGNFPAYRWSEGQGTGFISVGPGHYSVTVTDEDGCSGRDEITVREIPQLDVSITGDTTICLGGGAAILTTVSGTDKPVTLILKEVNSQTLLRFEEIMNKDRLPVFPDRAATYQPESVILPGYACPVLSSGSAQVAVNRIEGELMEVSSVSCAGKTDGRLFVSMSSSFPPLQYQWNTGDAAPFLNSIGTGWYFVVTTDQFGCIRTDSIFLTEPEPLEATFSVEPPRCFGIDDGTIALQSVNGGVGSYSWIVNDRVYNAINTVAAALSPGDYLVQVFDRNGCAYDTAFTFATPLPLQMDLGPDRKIKLGDTIHLQPNADFSDFSDWEWWPIEDTDRVYPDLTDRPLENQRYRLTLYNEYHCQVVDEVNVFVDKNNLIYAPNAFSPNGDGVNDYFTLYGRNADIARIDYLYVFDRWGGLLASRQDILLNDESNGWDGKCRGDLVGAGVYVWQAGVTYLDGRRETLVGEVVVVR